MKFGWTCSKSNAHHTEASCKRNPSARRKYSIGCVESDWKCLIKESVLCVTTVLTSSERLRNKCHCTNAMKAGTGFVHSCRACTEALEMMLLHWHQCYNYTEDPCSHAPETLSECTHDLSHIDEHDYKCVHNKFLTYACNSRILTEDSAQLNKTSTIWIIVTLSVISTILLSTLVCLALYCCCCSQQGSKEWNRAKVWKGAENAWAKRVEDIRNEQESEEESEDDIVEIEAPAITSQQAQAAFQIARKYVENNTGNPSILASSDNLEEFFARERLKKMKQAKITDFNF
ncbi:hypothetical protein DdX_05274 [Ditylenchus destructor]|uniref:Uncharacterized protein n=1 Tax=Ditylenchus destructor TaxID=166010 RepID=A0AAD4NEF3_9BILA|nr:hypothetical protein DdX_05274 [Ditylenchus destructor]